MDKFDPNPILVNVNKLKPYQFLDDKTQTVRGLKPIYWEGQGDDNVNDKEKDNDEEYVHVVQIQ